MLKKYFLSNIIIILLANFLVKPLWIFGIDRNVQNLVGHQAYGMYTALMSMTVLFNILLDLGLTNFNNREISADPNKIHQTLPNLLITKFILSGLYLVLISVFAMILNYSVDALYLLLLLGISQVLNSLVLFLRSNIAGHQNFKMDALVSVMDKLIMLILCGYLLFIYHNHAAFNTTWFVVTQIIAYAFTVTVAWIYIRKKYTLLEWSHFSWKQSWDLIKRSLPYALLIFIMATYMRGDVVLLERLSGAEETGLYANAFRILDVLNMVAVLFAGVLLSMFSKLLAAKVKIEELVTTSTNLLLPVSLSVVAFCMVYGKHIMTIMYHDSSQSMHLLFALVVFAFPAYAIMYIYSTLLTANWNITLLLRLSLIGALIALVLNLILVPSMKAQGTAIAALCTHWFLAITYLYYCVKNFSLSINVTRIISFVSLFLASLLINYLALYVGLGLIVAGILNIPLFLSMAYLFRFWNLEKMKGYFKHYG